MRNYETRHYEMRHYEMRSNETWRYQTLWVWGIMSLRRYDIRRNSHWIYWLSRVVHCWMNSHWLTLDGSDRKRSKGQYVEHLVKNLVLYEWSYLITVKNGCGHNHTYKKTLNGFNVCTVYCVNYTMADVVFRSPKRSNIEICIHP